MGFEMAITAVPEPFFVFLAAKQVKKVGVLFVVFSSAKKSVDDATLGFEL